MVRLDFKIEIVNRLWFFMRIKISLIILIIRCMIFIQFDISKQMISTSFPQSILKINNFACISGLKLFLIRFNSQMISSFKLHSNEFAYIFNLWHKRGISFIFHIDLKLRIVYRCKSSMIVKWTVWLLVVYKKLAIMCIVFGWICRIVLPKMVTVTCLTSLLIILIVFNYFLIVI